MAYREYIGSRYVPIFGRKDEDSIIWDNSKPYEPLTVVTYQGNSYTSRQFVPEGTDITNEAFWALTGNYNAQIEQYRQEVQQYNGRITTVEEGLESANQQIENLGTQLNEKIEDLESLVMGNLIVQTSGTVQGTSVLVSADDDEYILIDAGTDYTRTTQSSSTHVDDNESIRAWLANVLGEKKLSAFVISHFHPDHCGAIDTVAENFCDADTAFFMQMEVPQNTTSTDYQYYQTKRQVFTNAANALGATAVTPAQGTVYEFGDMQLSFANCRSQYATLYETVTKSDNGYGDDKPISINNYSLITRVEYAGSSYTNCGDVETPAQYLNAVNVMPSTFASYPHHGVNMMGYCEFFNKLCTDVFHITRSLDVQTGAVASIAQSVRWSYLNRYAHQIKMPVLFDNTINMLCIMHCGSIQYLAGNEFQIADSRDNDNNVPLISNVLPKASVFVATGNDNMIDNPYIIETYDLETILKESNELGSDVSFHLNGRVEYIQNMPAYTKAIEVFKWNVENSSIDADMENNPPLIYYTSGNPATVFLGNINAVMNMFYYSSSFSSSAFPNTQWKPAFPVAGSVRKIENLSIGEGQNTTDANAARMFRNTNLIAELDLYDSVNNVHYPVNIPLNRRATNQWTGVTNISTTGWCFIEVRHTVNTNVISVQTAKWVNFAGVEVGTVTVTGIVNPVSI